MENPYKIKIIKAIQKFGRVYSVWNVFSDFVELGALSIANSYKDGSELWKKRESQYLNTIGKYNADEQEILVLAFADLIMALEYAVHNGDPSDVLGEIFHALELHNKYKGQFFTPQHVCDMMSEIISGDVEEAIKKNGYVSLCEPCCGSGAMVLGFAKSMLNKRLNYSAQLFVEATDIDLKCVYMCYLQLSLYGIPAVVIHGNTLTVEEWTRFHTPVYIAGLWHYKRGVVGTDNKKRGANLPSVCGEQITLEDLERGAPK